MADPKEPPKEKIQQVKVYGDKDEGTIILMGDIEEDFMPRIRVSTYLGFSDGTVLEVHWDKHEICRIERLKKGSADYFKQDTEPEDQSESDIATLNGKLDWCIMGEEFVEKRFFSE